MSVDCQVFFFFLFYLKWWPFYYCCYYCYHFKPARKQWLPRPTYQNPSSCINMPVFITGLTVWKRVAVSPIVNTVTRSRRKRWKEVLSMRSRAGLEPLAQSWWAPRGCRCRCFSCICSTALLMEFPRRGHRSPTPRGVSRTPPCRWTCRQFTAAWIRASCPSPSTPAWLRTRCSCTFSG